MKLYNFTAVTKPTEQKQKPKFTTTPRNVVVPTETVETVESKPTKKSRTKQIEE